MGGTAILEWWNLVYAVPLAVTAFYLLVTAAFGLGDDAAHDHDHDHDLGHDCTLHHDVEHEMEADHDAEHEAEQEGDGVGGIAGLLLFLGGDKLSLGLLLQILVLLWSASGLIYNMVLEPWLGSPVLFFGPSLLLSGLTSLLLTRGLARLMGRYLPKVESSALGMEQLEGATARTIFAVDERGGAAHLRDRYGTLHQVACRSLGGDIAKGREVVLIEYRLQGDFFLVEPVPDEFEATAERLGPTVTSRESDATISPSQGG
ncbi:MAG: DUF1449 family protein [Armatimonadetes bacterium]|nr:DUF1449 family protein [Armatimonadota bacterium]